MEWSVFILPKKKSQRFSAKKPVINQVRVFLKEKQDGSYMYLKSIKHTIFSV